MVTVMRPMLKAEPLTAQQGGLGRRQLLVLAWAAAPWAQFHRAAKHTNLLSMKFLP